MSNFDFSKGSGPDGIQPALYTPLCIIFQGSFGRGTMFRLGRTSLIWFQLLSPGINLTKNYRYFSIISAIPKLLELILTEEIILYVYELYNKRAAWFLQKSLSDY